MAKTPIGVIKKVDINGRVSIPSTFRKMLDIELEEDVEIRLVMNNKEKVIEIRKV